MDISSKGNKNITTLRGLDTRTKAGRKRPRHGDYDYPTSPKVTPPVTDTISVTKPSRKMDLPVTATQDVTDTISVTKPSREMYLHVTATQEVTDTISVTKPSRKMDLPVTVTQEVTDTISVAKPSRKMDLPVAVAPTVTDTISVTKPSRKPDPPMAATQEVTDFDSSTHIDTEPGEPVQSNVSVSGQDWLRIGPIVLKDEEKNILYSPNEWVNDRIVDAAMLMLKRQFPHIWGIDSCINAVQLSFPRAHGNLIQIINRTPENGGSHWFTLSTMKLTNKSEIKIFDSSFTSLSFPAQQVVCNLLKKNTPPKRSDKILLKFMDCDFQTNGNDCGFYVIANATAVANGIDPCSQNYNVKLLRGHLFACFEKGIITPFPACTRFPDQPTGVRYTAYLKVFCTCRMPEDGLYVVCSKCKIWYHPECEDIKKDEIPGDDVNYFCRKCTNPPATNKTRRGTQRK